jgi:hypothetical protein
MASVENFGFFPKAGFNPFGCPFVRTGNPIGLPILTEKQAVQLCWRVKKWKLEFSAYSIYNWWFYDTDVDQWFKFGNQNYYSSVNFDGVLTAALAGFSLDQNTQDSHVGFAGLANPSRLSMVAANEKEIQCFDQRGGYFLIAVPSLDTNFDPNASTFFRIQIPILPSYYPSTNQYEMPLVIGNLPIQQQQFIGGISTGFFNSVRLVSSFSEDYDFLGEISFLGYIFVLKFKSDDYGTSIDTPPSFGPAGPSSSYGKTTSFSFKMSPSEYWPYDPNDGLGPIYNSLTGERIRFDI